LVETLIETVRDINGRNNQSLKSEFEVITLLHDEFKISATGNDDTTNVGSIIRDEVLFGELAALDNVQVALFLSETSETYSGLTTAAVLLGELHGHTLDNLLVVSLERSEKHSITIDDDKAELVIVFQK